MKNLKQKDLDIEFAKACKYGHYETAKQLFDEFYIKKNQSIFSPILNIFTPNLNSTLYSKDNKFLNMAIAYGHENILDIMFSNEKFVKKFANHFNLLIGVSCAFTYGRLDLGKKLLSFSKNKERFYGIMDVTLHNACETKNIESIKFLTTDPEFKQYLKFKPSMKDIEMDDLDIARHFIFELNMEKEHAFFKHYSFSNEILSLFDKKNLYDDLQKEFTNEILLDIPHNNPNIKAKRSKL